MGRFWGEEKSILPIRYNKLSNILCRDTYLCRDEPHVGRAYRIAGLADPTSAERVRLELKATRHVLRVRQRQAHPIRFKGEIADLDSPPSGLSLLALLKACRRDALGYRDAAILRLAYDTGVRRSELVRIDVADIEGPDADGAGVLLPICKFPLSLVCKHNRDYET